MFRLRLLSGTVAAAFLCIAATAGWADLTPYIQNFENLNQTDPSALANDNWVVFGNVYDDTTGTRLYGYGTFPAPNGGEAFSAIVTEQGGTEQGLQQLSVYNDYNNLEAHNTGDIVEANVFQEQTVGATDVGRTYIFLFNAKMGNLAGSSTAAAFIKTLDPNAGHALTNFLTVDMTTIPDLWGGYRILISITSDLAGQLLQFGFLNRASHYEGSGIYYDNVEFREATESAVPEVPFTVDLHQNVPNPFNPATRIDFDLSQREAVDVSVYDAAGRKIVTLFHGPLDPGPHSLSWNGRAQGGAAVSAGIYRYVLSSSTERLSRSMVLIK